MAADDVGRGFGRLRVLILALVTSLFVSCRGEAGIPVLNWYINADNGGQARLAQKCTAESRGRYRIDVSVLPKDATQQREQLVRRLAAKDSSIDLMSLDLPFVPEFAEAGFLRSFTPDEAKEFTAGVLKGPVQSAMWDGKLVAIGSGCSA